MPIAVDIDVMLARRKMSVGELADRVGITPANLAVLEDRPRRRCASRRSPRSARCSSASRATCFAGRPDLRGRMIRACRRVIADPGHLDRLPDHPRGRTPGSSRACWSVWPRCPALATRAA